MAHLDQRSRQLLFYLGSRVSLLASASESESTESSDREPHEVYSSLLESESACVVTGIPDSGTECVLRALAALAVVRGGGAVFFWRQMLPVANGRFPAASYCLACGVQQMHHKLP